MFQSTLDTDKRIWPILKRLFQETGQRHLGGYALALGLAGIVAGTTAGVTLLVSNVVNEVFVDKNFVALLGLSGVVMAVFVARGLAMFGQAVTLQRIANAIVLELQTKLFRRVMAEEPSALARRTSGDVMTVITTGAQGASLLLNGLATSVGRDLFQLIALLGTVIYHDAFLALLLLIVVPVVALIISQVARRLRLLARRHLIATAVLNDRIRGGVQGLKVVKAFGMEAAIGDKMAQNADDLRKVADKFAIVSNRVAPFMELAGGVAVAGAIALGGWRVIEGGQTPGELVAFLLAAVFAYDPARRLGNARVQFEQQLVNVRNMYAFLDAPRLQADPPGAPDLAVSEGAVRFEAVRFAYEPESPVLRGLSFSARPGRTTAIVGRSGAGKTTIANLLLRFWPLEAGRILIDEQGIESVTAASLRHAIAYVGQEAFLFDGSIRENILVGAPEADEARLREAAEAAGALDFIEKLPLGFDTPVGELGGQLSGGQRQRVAIARAFIRNSPIVLLDEPTSALDIATERAIQASLKRLAAGRTTLIITHRLGIIRDADQIIVLDHGQVVESGRHEELMARGGAYAGLAQEAETNPDL